MKNLLKILNIINLTSLFLFIPYSIFEENIFLFQVEEPNSFFTLMVNQFIICLIVSLATLFVAKKRKIETTRDGFQIIKKSQSVIRILVLIGFIACVVCGSFFFKEELFAFVLLSFLHSMSILLCSGIIKSFN